MFIQFVYFTFIYILHGSLHTFDKMLWRITVGKQDMTPELWTEKVIHEWLQNRPDIGIVKGHIFMNWFSLP